MLQDPLVNVIGKTISSVINDRNRDLSGQLFVFWWVSWHHTHTLSQYQLSSKLRLSVQARFRNVLPLQIQLVSPSTWLSLPNNHHWSLTIILLHLLCCKSMWQQFYVDLNLVYTVATFFQFLLNFMHSSFLPKIV